MFEGCIPRYIFSTLHYRRLVWHCDNADRKSKETARLIGFALEGVTRQCMVWEEESVDVAWYSVLDSEWPLLETALEQWLSSSNFDSARQKITQLEDIRLSLGWRPADIGMPDYNSTAVPVPGWTPKSLPNATIIEGGRFVRLEFLNTATAVGQSSPNGTPSQPGTVSSLWSSRT